MTQTQKHTPGPWHVGRKLSNCVVITAEGKDVGTVAINKYTDNFINEANARLMAAAPELLAALKRMVEAYWDNSVDHLPAPQVVSEARAAIAKAEGR